MDTQTVERWIARYERLWRTSGTERLTDLFSPEATYLPSPWAQRLTGLEEIASFWEAEREGADEPFTLSSDLVAVDGDTAVVRIQVEYGAPGRGRWRNLWIIGFANDGRCSSFEEWPFAPEQRDGH